jgi:hypothetical protein
VVAPTNTNFATPGSAPGTALGWVTNIQSAGVSIAGYRGTLPQPLGYEGFDHDWADGEGDFPPWQPGQSYGRGAVAVANGGVYQALNAGTSAATGVGPAGTGTVIDNPGLLQIAWLYVRAVRVPVYSPTNQNWAATIQTPSFALFDQPARPNGQPFEDFGLNWTNSTFLGATGPCNTYLLTIDTAEVAEYCAANPEASVPGWAPDTSYAQGSEVQTTSGVYLAAFVFGTGTSAASGSGPSGTGTYLDNPGPDQIQWVYQSPAPNPLPDAYESFGAGWSEADISISSSTDANPVVLTLATGHGVATGQLFPLFVAGHALNKTVNGLWSGAKSATALSPTTLSLPADGIAAGGATGSVSIQTAFETNVRPNAWAPDTSYLVGEVVLSNKVWYQAQTSGLSGTQAPSGTGTVNDGGVSWVFVRGAPGATLYSESTVQYESNAYESFSTGWNNDAYWTTLPSSTTASYHGWSADTYPNPAFVANAGAYETFFQLLGASILVALVDTGANLISLAPGKNVVNGAFITFTATPAYSVYGSSYPSPLVPGVEYIVWNATPALGLARLNIGDPSQATSVPIAGSVGSGPAEITTAVPHGLATGQWVFIHDHLLNTSVNGFFQATVIDTTHFTVPVAGISTGGATGTAYGPINLVTLTSAGAAQLSLTQDPAWDWGSPG